MKTKLALLSISAACIAQMNMAYADSGAFYGQPNPRPYPSQSSSNASWEQQEEQSQSDDSFKVKFAGPDGSSITFGQGGSNRRHHGRGRPGDLRWINVAPGFPPPPNAVVGGTENYQPLYLCRAAYMGGIHPGKIISGNCNISYAGKEIPVTPYLVLISRRPLNWEPASNGQIPPGAVAGGFENGHPLFVCQTRYMGGVHPGKIVGQTCNIAYGGREISQPFYNVLVNY